MKKIAIRFIKSVEKELTKNSNFETEKRLFDNAHKLYDALEENNEKNGWSFENYEENCKFLRIIEELTGYTAYTR